MGRRRPDAVLYWSTDQPDHWEDITGFVDRKVSALLSHSSQTETTMDDADSHRERFAAKITQRATVAGVIAGLAAAEAFKIVIP